MFVRLFYSSINFVQIQIVGIAGLPLYAVVRERRCSLDMAMIGVTRHLGIRDFRFLSSGDFCVVAPPVPIPNTEVKHHSSDGSACLACARVGRCQS
jgi:hypothetical protein